MKHKLNQKYAYSVEGLERETGLDYSAEGFDTDTVLTITLFQEQENDKLFLDVSIIERNHVDSVDTIELTISQENNPEFNKWIQEQIKGEKNENLL